MRESTPSNTNESLLDDVIDEIATRMNEGQSVDIEKYASKYPSIAEPLREAQAALVGVCQFRQEGENALEHQTQAELDVPRELGDFRLIREIGRGGMGIVYEAEQVSLQRPVALKVLPYAAVLDQRQLRRFRNEARAAAMLKHPNIVSVHAVGCERGFHFYAMELVEGQSLAEIVAQVGGVRSADDASSPAAEASRDNGRKLSGETDPLGQLTTSFSSDRSSYYRTIARMGVEAASALQYAHAEGVIHRDIKPANLLLDPDGKVLVADFGLALTHGDDAITATGHIVGTLRYMSPEQIAGDRVVDQRTDIYSLGLTLYEMIAGKPAFRGNDRHALSQQIIDGRLRPLAKARRAVPRDLETIVQKATAREADERYMTAAAMADDLQLFLDRRPIKARRASQLHRFRRWSRRNSVVAALLAAVFLLLAMASVAGIGGSIHLSNVAKRTKLQLYVSDMRRAAELFRDGDTLQAIKTLQRHVPKTGETDERHFEWFYLRSLCDRLSPKWTFGHPVSAYDARFSPDGKLLATCTRAEVSVWDVATGRKRQTLKGHRPRACRVLFSPDGHTLISGGLDGTVRFWDVESGKQTGIIGDPEKPVHRVLDLVLSPDGLHLAAVCSDSPNAFYSQGLARSVIVWEYDSKQRVPQLDGLAREASSLGFSPDSSFLTVGCDDGTILVWDCQSWKLAGSVDAHANGIQAVAYSPDGATCTSASFVRHSDFTRAEIKIWDPYQWTVRRVIQHHDAKATEIDYSPDSRWLLVASNDYNVSIWNVEDGKCVKNFRPHAARVFAARMSPDHAYLATGSADNFVKVWNCADLIRPSETRSVYEASEYVFSLTLADEGRSVITGDISGRITKRDTATGDAHYQFSAASPTDWRIEVAVSPDNQWLAVASGRKVGDVESGEIQIRDLETGVPRLRFRTPKAYRRGLDFSPDGKSLAMGSRHAVFVFDWETGNAAHELGPFRYVKQVKWSPTGDQLAVAENSGWTSIFNTSDYGQLPREIQTDDGWGTIGFDYSPDGSVFATGGGDKVVKIWDARTFELVDTFDECPDWIAHVAFSADGRRLLSTGKDGVLRVWHRDLGECLLTLNMGPLWPMNGRFSPDGNMIVAATDVLHIWRCKDQFEAPPIYTPPNQPCFEAMELQSANLAESRAQITNSR